MLDSQAREILHQHIPKYAQVPLVGIRRAIGREALHQRIPKYAGHCRSPAGRLPVKAPVVRPGEKQPRAARPWSIRPGGATPARPRTSYANPRELPARPLSVRRHIDPTPTLTQEAAGSAEQRTTETDYQDDLRRVITRQGPLPGSAAKLVTVRHYDSLGRIRLTQQLEDSLTESEASETKGIKTQTQYRVVSGGSLELASNPYRANTSAGAGDEETMGGR